MAETTKETRLCDWDLYVLKSYKAVSGPAVMTQEFRAAKRLAKRGLLEQRSVREFRITKAGRQYLAAIS